jgi:hypothetical protein
MAPESISMMRESTAGSARGKTMTQTFVTHLECSMTGERHDADTLHGLSRAGWPLLVRYDLEAAAQVLSKDVIAGREASLWKWRELLPVRRDEDVVSLGEIATPLVTLDKVGDRLGSRAPLVKDEGRLPTGSFKARGLVMAISMAKELGVRTIALPTNGNAGAAAAAYATRAGIESIVLCPDDTPEINVREIAAQGARVYRVNGLIDDCGKIVGEGARANGWFDLSTLKEPYRIEGKKTMGLELAEQLGWELPDAIFYPTGGGTGLIGMWKAFEGTGGDRLHSQGPAPAHVRGPGLGLRPDRQGVRGRHAACRALGECAHRRIRHPRAQGDRRLPDPAGGTRQRRGGFGGRRCGDRSRRGRCGDARRTSALPRGRCDARGICAGDGSGAGRPRRAGRAVQLRHWAQISAARSLAPARSSPADRSLRIVRACGGGEPPPAQRGRYTR